MFNICSTMADKHSRGEDRKAVPAFTAFFSFSGIGSALHC